MNSALPSIDIGPDSLLHFVHIPKTAGTSMRRYLDRFFLPQQVFPAELTARYDALDVPLAGALHRCCLDRYRLIRGHHCLDQLLPFFEASCRNRQRITILRDPVSQLISEYKMSQFDTNYPHHRELKGITLDQYLGHAKLPWIRGGNRMCSHLLSQHFTKAAYPGLDERFDILTELLASYAVVGIHEDMPATVRLIAKVFGWHCPQGIPHFNKSKVADPQLSESQQSRILEVTQLDRKLYAWANSRFQRQGRLLMQSLTAPADNSTPDPSALRAAINCQSTKRRDERLANPDRVGYIEVVNSEGFHLCHLDRLCQRQIQWVGPNPQARIVAGFSMPSDYVLSIDVVHWLKEDMLRDFRVRVNGEPVSLRQVRSNGSRNRIFQGDIPRRVIERNSWNTEILLETSSVASPHALGLNKHDDEQKCLAIGSVDLQATKCRTQRWFRRRSTISY